jgi:hypothetical protein
MMKLSQYLWIRLRNQGQLDDFDWLGFWGGESFSGRFNGFALKPADFNRTVEPVCDGRTHLQS